MLNTLNNSMHSRVARFIFTGNETFDFPTIAIAACAVSTALSLHLVDRKHSIARLVIAIGGVTGIVCTFITQVALRALVEANTKAKDSLKQSQELMQELETPLLLAKMQELNDLVNKKVPAERPAYKYTPAPNHLFKDAGLSIAGLNRQDSDVQAAIDTFADFLTKDRKAPTQERINTYTSLRDQIAKLQLESEEHKAIQKDSIEKLNQAIKKLSADEAPKQDS